MNDDRLTTALGSFYKGTALTPPDPERGLERVMTRVPQTRQRGPWWPLPSWGRASAMPSAITDPEHRSTPVPATNGYPTTITGRTQVMFSPVKAIITGAVVFALGGVFLITQPFDQQGGVVPGAATDTPGESTPVTGTSVCWLKTAGTYQFASAPYSLTDHVLTCSEVASDPRVTGTMTMVINIEGWSEGIKQEDPANSVLWTDYLLVGPDGTWSGHGYGFYEADGTTRILHIATGSGAYEGLTYTQSITVTASTANADTIGLIQTGPLPPGYSDAPFSEPGSE
jgi:hypothetical protein